METEFIRRKTLIVLGSLTLAVVAGLILLGRLMRLGYVDSAVVSMRALVAAEAKYAKAHPETGYACSLAALRSDELVADSMSRVTRNKYTFEIGGCHVGDGSPNAQYHVTARPALKGMPAFCSDQSTVLKYDDGGSIEKCLTSGVPLG